MTTNRHEWTRSLGPSAKSKPAADGKFPSYTSFITSISKQYGYTQLKSVAEFFTKTPPVSFAGSKTRSTTTQTLVADLIGDGDDRMHVHWRFTSGELNDEILSRKQNVKSRVILVECGLFAFIDRVILDFVAYRYKINPFDLWFLFERLLISQYYPNNPVITAQYPSIPYAMPRKGMPVFLWNGVPFDNPELSVDGAGCFIIDAEEGCPFPTVLILSQFARVPSIFRQSNGLEAAVLSASGQCGPKDFNTSFSGPAALPLDLYTEMLINLTPDTVLASPTELVFPYLKLVAWRIAAEVQEVQGRVFSDKMHQMKFGDESITRDWTTRPRIGCIDYSIMRGLRIFREFITVQNAESSLAAKQIIDELEWVSGFNRRLQDEMDRNIQGRISLSVLNESRKSIELSDDIAMLTRLAFVFIPLSFTASIFGMNIDELGSGPSPMWAFLLTAFIILCFTVGAQLYLRKAMVIRKNPRAAI
ncbi:hypothetical protein QBC38DRAFT_489726 [Podospora fimiseda]|uniref:Uncharacterized protein n=1 Tax=Podospora fimiseda TaxID=252190 RepID=A0AAN6YNH0_9PEZI|nr:hypothetical protein QBC38DRAFT_489726 [Podospora fimiseda]